MDEMEMKEPKDNKDVPSDVVELIIAVDLNPKDPQEPINVNDVSVKPKGEASQDGEDWKKLTMQVLMGDPKSGVQSDNISYDEAVEAVARVLGDSEPEEKDDPFTKASSRRSEPEKPEGDSPFEKKRDSRPFDKKRGGGMKAALERAVGKKPPFESGEDDDEEDEF